MINPYAVGHKINHPPKDKDANVIFQDIFIPKYFFSEDYLKLLPNLRVMKRPPKIIDNEAKPSKIDFLNDTASDYIRCVGIFSLRDIKDGEELYVNYFESNMIDVED